jgi:GMP reductase
MHIESDLKLDFGDVLIRPKRSTLTSRADVDITRTFRFRHSGAEWSGFPLIASNMDTIGTISMARALHQSNAMVALHKYYSVEQLAEFFQEKQSENTFYTMGTT